MARGGACTSSGLFLCPHSCPLERIASALVHLRAPSIDRGVQAGLWGVGLALFIWLGLLAIGVSGATSFIMAALAGAVIFLYVRLYGGDEAQRARRMP
jgi:hypothetical protein